LMIGWIGHDWPSIVKRVLNLFHPKKESN